MRTVGIIPARMASSRFPGKPLAPIRGRSMIEHVFRRSSLNRRFDEVCVATCDSSIAEAAKNFGCRAIMTSDSHQRGTERVAEAAHQVEADIIVNIQGDEPLVRPEIFDGLLAPFESERSTLCTNLMARLSSDEEQDSVNNVKVVVDQNGHAMYFSREPIPSRRMGARSALVFRQIGIYALTKAFLLKFLELRETPFEVSESCDMLRFLEHGFPIRMIETEVRLQSVDSPADLEQAERLMTADDLMPLYDQVR